MDQNQTIDNDLQKAIDDIANTTNDDPVFSDPVAAPSSIPENDSGKLSDAIGPFPDQPDIQMIPPEPEPIAPLQSATSIPELNTLPPTNQPPEPINNPIQLEDQRTITPPIQPNANVTVNSNISEIKKAALRDLIPILDRIKMNPSQKFKVYRDIFEDLQDHSVLEPAYRAAKELPDETERAEALLYLIESIDKL